MNMYTTSIGVVVLARMVGIGIGASMITLNKIPLMWAGKFLLMGHLKSRSHDWEIALTCEPQWALKYDREASSVWAADGLSVNVTHHTERK